MTLAELTKAIWTASSELTYEQAEKIARNVLESGFTRDTKQTRVLRAEEVR